MQSFTFIDRESELASLGRVIESAPPQLLRLYGRRRTGKTWLLREALRRAEGVHGLYLVADQGEPATQLRLLGDQISHHTGAPIPVLRTWDELFDELERSRARVVVLDEFPYLVRSDASVGTRLQHRWDSSWQHRGPSVILCGSSIGMMRQLTRGRSGPLFGRLTADLRVTGMDYRGVRQFYPNVPEEERVVRYAIFGRSPFNHALNAGRTLWESIETSFLRPEARLQDEPRMLLVEARAPSRYYGVLEAMGEGARSLPDLERAVGTVPGALFRYLRTLHHDLDLIRPGVPVGALARHTRWEFADPFLAFYFRFIPKCRGLLEMGDVKGARHIIERDLNAHVGQVFEDVVHEALRLRLHAEIEGHRTEFDSVGRWWGRSGDEIDVVARSPTEVWVGEVKWSTRPVSLAVVRNLRQKAGLLPHLGRRGIRPFLVARGPVSPEAREELQSTGGFVLCLEDLAKIFEGF